MKIECTRKEADSLVRTIDKCRSTFAAQTKSVMGKRSWAASVKAMCIAEFQIAIADLNTLREAVRSASRPGGQP